MGELGAVDDDDGAGIGHHRGAGGGIDAAQDQRQAGDDGGGFRALGTPQLDSVRLDDVWTLDLRLSKNVKIAGSTSVGITADLFNVFNDNVVLQRTRDARSGAFNQVNELINPRVVRIGLRLQF